MELVVRGTVMYWFLFLLFRFVLRRDVGSIGIADVLLLVLIADAAQNAMAGSYESITEGCLLVATIAGWNWLVDFATWRFASLRRVLEPQPLPLVRDGRLLRRNMRREFITVEELMSQLREHGLDSLEQVKAATMENDGQISVIRRDGASPPVPSARKHPPG
nr:YetF domain-containing protein [Ramlibacter lithotrophicus]